jgi:hypothetical protein
VNERVGARSLAQGHGSDVIGCSGSRMNDSHSFANRRVGSHPDRIMPSGTV